MRDHGCFSRYLARENCYPIIIVTPLKIKLPLLFGKECAIYRRDFKKNSGPILRLTISQFETDILIGGSVLRD